MPRRLASAPGGGDQAILNVLCGSRRGRKPRGGRQMRRKSTTLFRGRPLAEHSTIMCPSYSNASLLSEVDSCFTGCFEEMFWIQLMHLCWSPNTENDHGAIHRDQSGVRSLGIDSLEFPLATVYGSGSKHQGEALQLGATKVLVPHCRPESSRGAPCQETPNSLPSLRRGRLRTRTGALWHGVYHQWGLWSIRCTRMCTLGVRSPTRAARISS